VARGDSRAEETKAAAEGLSEAEVARLAPKRLPALTPAEMVLGLSRGLDLAEGRPKGHAHRVCYVALSLGRSIELSEPALLSLFYAALFHDLGAPLASVRMTGVAGGDDTVFARAPFKSPESLAVEAPESAFEAIVDALHLHCQLGADAASSFGLDEAAAEAIRTHHERWDGSGYPSGLAERDIPLLGRVLAAADVVESLIWAEQSPLAARRAILSALVDLSGAELEPALVERACELCRRDDFWLGLHDDDISEALLSMKPAEESRGDKKHVLRFAEAFADVVDARSHYPAGHSQQVAAGAERLARELGFPKEEIETIRVAALLRDVGNLGVPAQVLAKPDVLDVSEMQLLRLHPSYSRLVLEGLPGLEGVARWVEAHHERPDGRGYPEMLEGRDIPLEAKIIAVAGVYAALTSERPYRAALTKEDARKVLEGAGGSQLDPELVGLFCSHL
jgi:HD-GYP domain-containing protein (c-di-GMP phosphodiesterase class II)